MAQTSYPFTGQSISETQYRALARTYAGDRIHSGLDVTVSGTTISVGAGMATVDGTAYVLDTQTTLTATANTTGASRRVYAILRMAASGDNRTALAIAYGPRGGGAYTPVRDETGVWEMPLGYSTQASGASSLSGWTYVAARDDVAAPALAASTALYDDGYALNRGAITTGASCTGTFGPMGVILWVWDCDLYMGSDNIAVVSTVSAPGGVGDETVARTHSHSHGPGYMHAHGVRMSVGVPGVKATATARTQNEANSTGAAWVLGRQLRAICL